MPPESTEREFRFAWVAEQLRVADERRTVVADRRAGLAHPSANLGYDAAD